MNFQEINDQENISNTETKDKEEIKLGIDTEGNITIDKPTLHLPAFERRIDNTVIIRTKKPKPQRPTRHKKNITSKVDTTLYVKEVDVFHPNLYKLEEQEDNFVLEENKNKKDLSYILTPDKTTNLYLEEPVQLFKIYHLKKDLFIYSEKQEDKLQTTPENGIERDNLSGDFFLGAIIIFNLIILVWIKLNYYKVFRRLISSFFRFPFAKKMYREKHLTLNSFYFSFWLNLLFGSTVSLFAYQLNNKLTIQGETYEGFYLYCVYFSIISLTALLKYILIKIVGYIFFIHKQTQEFLYNNLIYLKSSGILLFPFVSLMPYLPLSTVPTVINITATIMGLVFIFKFSRIFNFLILKSVPLFYIFLYLCALEIVPIIILYKLYLTLL